MTNAYQLTVTLHGQLQPGVTGKDVIITLCGLFNRDEVLNHAVEFSGDGTPKASSLLKIHFSIVF